MFKARNCGRCYGCVAFLGQNGSLPKRAKRHRGSWLLQRMKWHETPTYNESRHSNTPSLPGRRVLGGRSSRERFVSLRRCGKPSFGIPGGQRILELKLRPGGESPFESARYGVFTCEESRPRSSAPGGNTAEEGFWVPRESPSLTVTCLWTIRCCCRRDTSGLGHGNNAHAPCEYYFIDSTNPKAQDIDGATRSYAECRHAMGVKA